MAAAWAWLLFSPTTKDSKVFFGLKTISRAAEAERSGG